MANIHCPNLNCDNNCGPHRYCMFGITSNLIRAVKEDRPVCDTLKKAILEILKEVKDSET